jgi:hypothetical protein
MMGSMMTAWPVIVFGAPGAIIGLALCVTGLVRSQPLFLLVGSLTLAPSALFLGSHPGFGVLFLLPLLPLVAAYALSRSNRFAAGLLLMPNAVAVLWLSAITVSNLVVN